MFLLYIFCIIYKFIGTTTYPQMQTFGMGYMNAKFLGRRKRPNRQKIFKKRPNVTLLTRKKLRT